MLLLPKSPSGVTVQDLVHAHHSKNRLTAPLGPHKTRNKNRWWWIIWYEYATKFMSSLSKQNSAKRFKARQEEATSGSRCPAFVSRVVLTWTDRHTANSDHTPISPWAECVCMFLKQLGSGGNRLAVSVKCAHHMYVFVCKRMENQSHTERIQSKLPGRAWCVCEWRIHERVESATAAAPPPEPAPHPAGHSGDQEIRPSPVIAPFPSPWCCHSLLLSSKLPPPSPGSLRPSALGLLPLGADGRCVVGVLGHLVMPLPLLDTDTSTVRKGEVQERGREEDEERSRENRTEIGGKIGRKQEQRQKKKEVSLEVYDQQES